MGGAEDRHDPTGIHRKIMVELDGPLEIVSGVQQSVIDLLEGHDVVTSKCIKLCVHYGC